MFLFLFAHTILAYSRSTKVNAIISITNNIHFAAQSTPNHSPVCCATHLDFAELHPVVTISPNQAIRRLDCQICAQSRSPVRHFPLPPPSISGRRRTRRRVLCSASSPSWSSHDHAAQQPPGFRSPASPDSLCSQPGPAAVQAAQNQCGVSLLSRPALTISRHGCSSLHMPSVFVCFAPQLARVMVAKSSISRYPPFQHQHNKQINTIMLTAALLSSCDTGA